MRHNFTVNHSHLFDDSHLQANQSVMTTDEPEAGCASRTPAYRTKAQATTQSVLGRRSKTRRKTLACVDILCRDNMQITGIIHNISHEGLFIVSYCTPAINERVVINLPSSDRVSATTISGTVIHRKEYGFGVAIEPRDVKSYALINDLIHRSIVDY